jgi:hypothetical protein
MGDADRKDYPPNAGTQLYHRYLDGYRDYW